MIPGRFHDIRPGLQLTQCTSLEYHFSSLALEMVRRFMKRTITGQRRATSRGRECLVHATRKRAVSRFFDYDSFLLLPCRASHRLGFTPPLSGAKAYYHHLLHAPMPVNANELRKMKITARRKILNSMSLCFRYIKTSSPFSISILLKIRDLM